MLTWFYSQYTHAFAYMLVSSDNVVIGRISFYVRSIVDF